ncbi:hypothetical protein [Orbus mooreae]|uniref:hypothetical protein n=1 Tax=Orbus mooreae TaxID=3074107 RepID=UPI00370DD43A
MKTISTLILKDIPDLMCDGCVVDSDDNLIFLSVWGRDTAMQELLGKITIGSSSNMGLAEIRLLNHLNLLTHAKLTKDREYDKRTQKFQHPLFGTLNHAWIFDSRTKTPCRTSQSTILMFDSETSQGVIDDCLFESIKHLTSIPLLDHWKKSVVTIAKEHDMIQDNTVLCRQLKSMTMCINEHLLAEHISLLIQKSVLTL